MAADSKDSRPLSDELQKIADTVANLTVYIGDTRDILDRLPGDPGDPEFQEEVADATEGAAYRAAAMIEAIQAIDGKSFEAWGREVKSAVRFLRKCATDWEAAIRNPSPTALVRLILDENVCCGLGDAVLLLVREVNPRAREFMESLLRPHPAMAEQLGLPIPLILPPAVGATAKNDDAKSSDTGASAATSDAQESAGGEDAGEKLKRLTEVIGDEEARIVRIAADETKTVEQRMMTIVAVDRRFLAKDSEEWKTLLDCSSPAVRKTDFWGMIRRCPDKAYQHALDTCPPP